LLFNEDVVIGVSRGEGQDRAYFSNGDADELVFVQRGAGTLKSVFGDLEFGAGDYLVIPKGVLHRFAPAAGEQFWFRVECLGGLGVPPALRNQAGQLRMDAPFCHRDFERPRFVGPLDEGIRHVVVKRGGAFHGFEFRDSPFDVVGWDGSVYPVALPIRRFQPKVGAVHLPPSVHGTFEARGALICSFVPRPLDFRPGAIPCPYPHSSVDMDEVLFYSSGDFVSRRGIGAGSVSHHPAGVPHGPHPGAYEASLGARTTEELAVMLDCERPLCATAAALAIEDTGYHAGFADA
jgi:homogentisate 1,2-dioxygenase